MVENLERDFVRDLERAFYRAFVRYSAAELQFFTRRRTVVTIMGLLKYESFGRLDPHHKLHRVVG